MRAGAHRRTGPWLSLCLPRPCFRRATPRARTAAHGAHVTDGDGGTPRGPQGPHQSQERLSVPGSGVRSPPARHRARRARSTFRACAPSRFRAVLSGPDGEVWARFWVTEAPAPRGTAAAPAEVLDTYAGLPDGGVDGADSMVRLGSGEYALTISLPGTGECAAVPIATEVDGRTVTIVVRDPAQACAPDGTHTTYVLALPDGASAESVLTTRAEGSLEAPYPQLRLWLEDVVAVRRRPQRRRGGGAGRPAVPRERRRDHGALTGP